MAAPLVSVVIPTRDRHDLVWRAVASALEQPGLDIEVVVVDDGSRRPVLPIAGDTRARVLRLSHPRGVCAARNLGLRHATAQWVTFLDDDDELLPSSMSRSLEAVRQSTLALPVAALCAIEVIGADGQVQETRRPPTMARGRHYFLEDDRDGHFQTQNTLLVEASLLRSIGGWDEKIRSAEHDDLFLRLNAVCSLQGTPDVGYRLHSPSGPRLSAALLARADGMRRTWTKHRKVFAHHRRRESTYLGTTGTTYLRAGRWGPAVRATTRSLMLDPSRPRALRQWTAALAGPRVRAAYDRWAVTDR